MDQADKLELDAAVALDVGFLRDDLGGIYVVVGGGESKRSAD